MTPYYDLNRQIKTSKKGLTIMNYKKENIDGYYNENGKEYAYTLEVIIRDDTGRNDTFEIVWENETPANAEKVEEGLVDEYFEKQHQIISGLDKLDKAVDALLDALTCTWEDNGNIMADAVRDNVLNVLAGVTENTINEIENMVEERMTYLD